MIRENFYNTKIWVPCKNQDYTVLDQVKEKLNSLGFRQYATYHSINDEWRLVVIFDETYTVYHYPAKDDGTFFNQKEVAVASFPISFEAPTEKIITIKPGLFNLGAFKLHSGIESLFKIDCDALSDEDLNALAYMYGQLVDYKRVVSVPTGGDRFAAALEKHIKKDPRNPILICDDVLTTGGSIERMRLKVREEVGTKERIQCVVIFKRRNPLQYPKQYLGHSIFDFNFDL